MKKSKSCRREGFTLIEVLLVLMILVTIMGLAMGSYFAQQKRAKRNAAITQIGLFKTPLATFNLDVGMYPTTNQGLAALRYIPSDIPNQADWGGPYLDSDVPLDPWGRQYNYASPGRYNVDTYDVWSVGPDGFDGNEDDVGNWTSGR